MLTLKIKGLNAETVNHTNQLPRHFGNNFNTSLLVITQLSTTTLMKTTQAAAYLKIKQSIGLPGFYPIILRKKWLHIVVPLTRGLNKLVQQIPKRYLWICVGFSTHYRCGSKPSDELHIETIFLKKIHNLLRTNHETDRSVRPGRPAWTSSAGSRSPQPQTWRTVPPSSHRARVVTKSGSTLDA